MKETLLLHHIHEKRKIVWKLGPFLIIFRIQVEI